MSSRPSIFNSVMDSGSKSKFKTPKELAKLIRGAKRECYPGIPYTNDYITVEDEEGPCDLAAESLDWLELSMLVENKAITLPGKTRLQLALLGIFIPEKSSIN